MTRFLVTGASGLLGLNFCVQAASAHEVSGIVNSVSLKNAPFQVIQHNLEDHKVFRSLIDSCKPEVIIHCAAMANIDNCESQPQLAFQINADLPAGIARQSRELGIKLVHISTDAVFDGIKGDYSESDPPNPVGVYTKTKLAGENLVLSENPDALIARVNFYGYSISGSRSLSEFFLKNLRDQKPMMGFTDVRFNPLLVNHLVDLLLEMTACNLKGIYHTLSSETLTKYEFGCRIAKKFNLDQSLIRPISVKQSGLVATRSLNLNLRTDKLRSAIGHELPDQQAGIDELFRLNNAGYAEKIRALRG
jgi:dTDP-4-dehydrorhamnose reductase